MERMDGWKKEGRGMAAWAHSPDFDLDLEPQTGKRMDTKFTKSTTAR